MESSLRIDKLIHNHIENNLSVNALNVINYFDCQDTDDDNATECYFYVKNDISEEDEKELIFELSNILGVDAECAIVDKSNEYDNVFRIEFIVEICSYSGKKFE